MYHTLFPSLLFPITSYHFKLMKRSLPWKGKKRSKRGVGPYLKMFKCFIFCSNCLPLSSTRWVHSTIKLVCSVHSLSPVPLLVNLTNVEFLFFWKKLGMPKFEHPRHIPKKYYSPKTSFEKCVFQWYTLVETHSSKLFLEKIS